jgi:hypothetical protein
MIKNYKLIACNFVLFFFQAAQNYILREYTSHDDQIKDLKVHCYTQVKISKEDMDIN